MSALHKPPRWTSRAAEVVDAVYSHSKSLMFHRAVDTKASDCENYYDKIKNPIDLTTIKVTIQCSIN